MYPSFPVENPEMLEDLMRRRRFNGTSTRLNVAANNETYIHKNGRAFLKEKILSDVVREGAIFDEVKKHHPWVEQLTLNKNLLCTPHKDRNEGTSLICFLGDFEGGGGLFVEEPEGLRHCTDKYTWYEYNGRHVHYTEPWETGDRYSIVAYKKPAKKQAAACAEPPAPQPKLKSGDVRSAAA